MENKVQWKKVLGKARFRPFQQGQIGNLLKFVFLGNKSGYFLIYFFIFDK